MSTPLPLLRKPLVVALVALGLVSATAPARADEREDLERLRATVLGLIDTLVKNGVLPRDKVNAMMRESEVAASTRLAQMAAPAAEVGTDGKKIVRVPYVPESVKAQLREQIKADVLAQTKAERAGGGMDDAGSGRIRVDGDVRVRAEATRLDQDNTRIGAIDSAASVTRAPDFLTLGGANKDLHLANTTENSQRARVRARIGATIDVAEGVSATLGIATGAVTGPTSTNQTLAQNGFFNKSAVLLDRASVQVEGYGLKAAAGRFRNPFTGTDLLWADDLNFDGLSIAIKPRAGSTLGTYATAGWFPLSPGVPNQSSGRSLIGAQAGLDWQIGQKDNHLKLAVGLYDFRGVEGIRETSATQKSRADYVVRSEYGAGYRQRGNTLFRINAPLSVDAATNWGLASGFRELDVTASVDLAQFDPVHVVLSADVVKNLKYKSAEVATRTGLPIGDGKSFGYLARLMVGMPTVSKAGQWNASLTYRYLGSDAVLDAFTSSDFGLGGTNSRGFVAGVNYGLARNTWLSARWMSSDLIETVLPARVPATPKTKFSVDLIQVDLNTRF